MPDRVEPNEARDRVMEFGFGIAKDLGDLVVGGSADL